MQAQPLSQGQPLVQGQPQAPVQQHLSQSSQASTSMPPAGAPPAVYQQLQQQPQSTGAPFQGGQFFQGPGGQPMPFQGDRGYYQGQGGNRGRGRGRGGRGRGGPRNYDTPYDRRDRGNRAPYDDRFRGYDDRGRGRARGRVSPSVRPEDGPMLQDEQFFPKLGGK